MIQALRSRRSAACAFTALLLLCILMPLRATLRHYTPVDRVDFLEGFALGLSLPFCMAAIVLSARSWKKD